MVTNHKKVSKYISKLLRHDPEELTMDAFGFVYVVELLNKLQIDKIDLDYIVATNDKKRFSYNFDMSKIRANQGHNKDLDVNISVKVLDETNIPKFLYHGTAKKNLKSIFKSGLIPGSRQYVHLSTDIETAKTVAKRHSKDIVILKVDALYMVQNDKKIVLSDNNVHLTKHVDPQYILVLDDIENKLS